MPDAPAPFSDPSRCPLCGGDNRCAMAIEQATGEPQAPCWCVSQSFPSTLLARLPEAATARACICARCVATHSAPTAAPAGRA